MATKLKLSEPGDVCVLRVASVVLAKGNLGDDYAFTGLTPDDVEVTIYVPEKSAARQLERMQANSGELAGQTVKISRSVELGKNQKPFWNIDWAVPADAKAKAPSKRQQPGSENAPPTDFASPEPPDGIHNPQHPAADVPIAKAGEKPAAGQPTKAQAIEVAYLALFDRCWTHLAGARDTATIATAQAMAATVWITMKEKGLL